MRERIYFQTVAYFLIILSLIIFSSPVQSEVIKPIISDALNKGDTALAIQILNNEIELDKTYHLNYFYLGRIYFERFQYNQAAQLFEMALSKKKKHYESLYYLALSYLHLGDLDKSQELMEQGRKKDKKNKHRFEDGFGQVMLVREDYQEADRAFRQAIVDDPNNAMYHIHLGDANFYQGIPSLAISEYEIALEVDTASLEVYYHWAEACLEMRDFNCAIEKLSVVLTKDSTYAPAWNRAAGIYFKAARSSRDRTERKNRFIETIGAYKKYLELSNVKLDSSNVRVYFELAMSYVNVFGYEDAVDYFKIVLDSIKMVPKDIYFYYGKSLWGVKDYVKSGEMLLKHIEWTGQQNGDYKSIIKDYELYQLLGDSYYYRDPKDFSTAIDYYKKSLADRPEQKRIVQNIAVGYHSLKSYSQALEYYDKRIEFGIDEKSASLVKNAGYCALNIANNAGDDEDEDIEEEEMIETAPVDDRNFYEVAINYFIKYLEHTDADVKILTAIASTYLYQLGDCANGVKYFEQVTALEPDNCEAKKSLGYAYFGGVCTKNYSKALNFLRGAHKCISSSGDCSDINLTLWIAQCYHLRAADKLSAKQDANDDFKAAFNWYEKVLKCEPNHVEAKKGRNDVSFEFGN